MANFTTYYNLAKSGDLDGFTREWATARNLDPNALSQTHSNAVLAAYTAAAASNGVGTGSGGTGSGGTGGAGMGYTPPPSNGLLLDPLRSLENLIKSATITPKGATEGMGDWFKVGSLVGGIDQLITHPINAIESLFGGVGDMINTFTRQQEYLLEKVNQESSLTGDLSSGFRQEITASVSAANKLGIHFSEVAESVSNMVTESGRFKLINQETIEQVEIASRMFGTMSELMKAMPSFEKVSLGVSDASKVIDKSYKDSVGLGLVGRETTKSIASNLEKLNQYGFKNGVEGLTRMVQRSQELKISMDQAFKIADEVMDPTKALEMSSRLQVIGGAIGDFNDPIKMMYMATNDVNGLQEALAKSAESLVTFNQQTGRFQIVGADLRRAREMANAMGVDFKELTNVAITAAQRTSAAADLMVSGLHIDEDQREFITNMAQMKEGRMVIEVPKDLRDKMGLTGENTSVALENMTQSQADYLLKNQQFFKDLTSEDIARQQFGLIQNIENDVNSIKSAAVMQLGVMTNIAKKELGIGPENIKEWDRTFAESSKHWQELITEKSKENIKIEIEKVKGKINIGGNENNENESSLDQSFRHNPNQKPNTVKPKNIEPDMQKSFETNPIKSKEIKEVEPKSKVISENVSSKTTGQDSVLRIEMSADSNFANSVMRSLSTNPEILASIKKSYHDNTA